MKKVFGVLGAAVILSGALVAQDAEAPGVAPSIRTGVVIGKTDKALTLWTKNGQEKFTYAEGVILPQRKMRDGNMVVVFEQTKGSRIASRVTLVDEQIDVTGKASKQRAVIGRTAAGRSPGHLIIKTLDGKEAFVIDPKVFRQPLPTPDQRVAVTYRVENVKPPIYKATGIVVLADKLDESPVQITYSEIPKAEPVVAAAPLPEPEPEVPVVIAELPQTASALPLLALAGALLLVVGLRLRRSYS